MKGEHKKICEWYASLADKHIPVLVKSKWQRKCLERLQKEKLTNDLVGIAEAKALELAAAKTRASTVDPANLEPALSHIPGSQGVMY